MTLQEIYLKHKKGDWPDKNSVHSYIPVYEDILAPYRYDTNNNILEIGLMGGESLRMWNEYFQGMVYGMDCSTTPVNGMADLRPIMKEGYNIAIGDASNSVDVQMYFKGMKFDVIIEDANHDKSQQFNIYETMKPYINKGGIYIIEDIQNIDREWDMFQHIDNEKTVEVIDRRTIKGRYDDVLIVIK